MDYLSENRGRYDDFRVHLVHLEFSSAENYISLLVDLVRRKGFAPRQLVTKSVTTGESIFPIEHLGVEAYSS